MSIQIPLASCTICYKFVILVVCSSFGLRDDIPQYYIFSYVHWGSKYFMAEWKGSAGW